MLRNGLSSPSSGWTDCSREWSCSGSFPIRGRVVPEWGDEDVREILYQPYRLVYEVFPDEVHILTLSHFRQELQDR